MTDYVSNGLAQAEQSQNRNVTLALIVLQRRLASSLYAATRSLERRRDRLTEELGQARKSGKFAQTAFQTSYDPDEDDLDALTVEDEEAISGASTAKTADELAREIEHLNGLIKLAVQTRDKGPERKLIEFQQAIESATVADRTEKILVFTEHRDTLTYLTRRLKEQGYAVCNIHGGMKLGDRIAAEKEFRGPAQFMVANRGG